MKILATIDKSRKGKDCWIYESYSMIRVFDKNYMICTEYNRSLSITTYSHDEIMANNKLKAVYDELCGIKL